MSQRQIGLQAEGPGAFSEPEVVAELKLTAEQRDRMRTIQDEALFGWMRGAHAAPAGGPGARGRTANERILAGLTEEQVRRWRATAGEPLKSPIALFPPPPAP